MPTHIRSLAALLALMVSFGSICYGATVSGTVKDPDGAPFEGAFVQALNTKTKITTMGVSDTQGRYQVENLPAGDYQLQIRAVGYRGEPRTGVKLAADQNTSFDFALQKGVVRWSDLNIYQAGKLLPAAEGKDILFSSCHVCHGFQTRMAAVSRDEEGWKDRIKYMRDAMHFNLGNRFTDARAATLAAYLARVFGPESVLPKSPADLPAYKDTLRTPSPKATNIQFVEYDMPGPDRMPFSAAPAKDGTIWIPNFGSANKITKLDPKTGEMKEFRTPDDRTAAVHSAFPATDGSVWIATQGTNKLERFDPATEKFTVYQDTYPPGKEGLAAFAEKHTVRIDRDGNAWATGNPLTRLDSKTGEFKHWDEVPHLYGLDFDPQGNLWFTKHDEHSQLGKVDTKTMKLSLYSPPNHNRPLYSVTPEKDGTIRMYPRRIAVDSDGMVWLGLFNAGYIDRFDPKTEKFTEFELPGPEATPYGLVIDADHKIWYSSYHQDVLGCLDPKTGRVTEYPFPHSENTIRELFLDSQGRIWYGSPSNNKVGYFYLTGKSGRTASVNNLRASAVK